MGQDEASTRGKNLRCLGLLKTQSRIFSCRWKMKGSLALWWGVEVRDRDTWGKLAEHNISKIKRGVLNRTQCSTVLQGAEDDKKWFVALVIRSFCSFNKQFQQCDEGEIWLQEVKERVGSDEVETMSVDATGSSAVKERRRNRNCCCEEHHG